MLIYEIFWNCGHLINSYLEGKLNVSQVKEEMGKINHLVRNKYSAAVSQFCNYYLCCYVDDIILQNKLQWRENLLEEYFFYSHQGGGKFFYTIENAEESFFILDQWVLLYLMLYCGFKGKFLEQSVTTIPVGDALEEEKKLELNESLAEEESKKTIKYYLGILQKKINIYKGEKESFFLCNQPLPLTQGYIQLPVNYSWIYMGGFFVILYLLISTVIWFIYLHPLVVTSQQIALRIFDYQLA